MPDLVAKQDRVRRVIRLLLDEVGRRRLEAFFEASLGDQPTSAFRCRQVAGHDLSKALIRTDVLGGSTRRRPRAVLLAARRG